MTRRRRVTLLGLALLALGAAAYGADERVELPLRLLDPAGGELRVEAGRGPLHLVFFATWCPPCLEELPRLGEIEARWADRGYRLVLVAVPSRQTRERLAQFVKRSGPPGQVGFDEGGTLQRTLEVEELPAHVLLGPDGTVLLRAGALDPALEGEIARVLAPARR